MNASREVRPSPPPSPRRRGGRLSSFVSVIAFLLTTSTSAQTTRPVLSASLGFDGVYKPESWTPVYVRVADAAARPATVEIRTARGRIGHSVSARIVTGATPTTYTLYAPIGSLDRVSLQLRDVRGGLIEALDLTDAAQRTPAALGGPAFGVAGEPGDAQRVVNQLVNGTGEYVAAGALAPRLLPDRAIGYDSVDALVLAGLDADALDDATQRAILAWVRSGGVLVAWPGSRSPTRRGPLVDALPATIGEPASLAFGGREVVGRRLIVDPLAHAVTDLSGGANAIVSRRVGLGQIVLCAFDPSRLAASPAERVALWRTLTSDQFALDAADRREGVFDPLIARAVGEQQLPVPAAPTPLVPTSLVVAALLLGLILGPGEVALLVAARRHPRAWHTLAGGALALASAGRLAFSPRSAAAPDWRIEIVVETADGPAQTITLGSSLDAGGMGDRPVRWLTASRTDPTNQPAAALALGQRDAGFEPLEPIHAIGGDAARVRGVNFGGDVATPTSAKPTTASTTPATVSSTATRDAVTVAGVVTPADDPSTRRVETGIERLATRPGWEAILLDRRLAERLVRLQETQNATVRATRREDASGVRFVLSVER